jgi:hypothetical protein
VPVPSAKDKDKKTPSSGRMAAMESSSNAFFSDVKDVMTGKEAALSAAITNISASYMHHILWPRSPYLLIVSTRSIILARINRAAAGMSSMDGVSTRPSAAISQVVNLCWQVPVVTAASISSATSASLMPSSFESMTHYSFVKSLELQGSPESKTHVKRGRTGAAIGIMAGHVAYTNLLDSMAELMAEVETGGAASVRQTGGGKEDRALNVQVRRSCSPAALMDMDNAVQRVFTRLSGKSMADPIFHLPSKIMDAMTVYVEPMPLYFADAMATLANVRVDQSPQNNVESIIITLAFVDTAYSRYCKDRLAFLQANPECKRGEKELDRLLDHHALEADDLVPLFNYLVAKSSIDRPVLVAVLASMWLVQEGLHEGRDGFALSMFKSACGWAASIAASGYEGL